eukprot:TRINITY_DN2066_c0_g1_i1.p2 TRINITY_DN2066_c0_g1~~TRINITY_DN2066_c0_g1_i1.p2  ORF type:complete len:173 (+),score=55.80 TRINITY_DN2066_c0_g1_i1:56-574(+)
MNSNDVEMEDFSAPVGKDTNQQEALLYRWDGDCHLVVNDRFYSSEIPEKLDSEANFMDADLDFFSPPVDIPPACLDGQESECASVSSTNYTGPLEEVKIPLDKSEGNEIMDKLDFIMGSSAKQPKNRVVEKKRKNVKKTEEQFEILRTEIGCLLYTSPSPRDATLSRMPSSA